MTTTITITLPEHQIEAIRRAVDRGQASSVSGFVQHAVGVALVDRAEWGEMLADALDQTGGPLTDAERAWTHDILGVGPSTS